MNNYLIIKLKSGALQFAIYTGAIVALLLFGLILYLHTFKTLQQSTEITTENIKTSNVGFFKIMEVNDIIGDTITISDFTDKNQLLKSTSSFWGIFQKTVVIAKNKNKTFQKCALLGCNFSVKDRLSLYLFNSHKPLIVVGDTRVQGNVRIPDQGVQSGFIAGNGFAGKNLIDGNISLSSDSMPELNTNLMEELEKYGNNYDHNISNYILDNNIRNINSFLTDTKIVYNKENILITQEIAGNFVIKSDNTITIMKSSRLSDAIFIAPHIIIEDGVVGNFQAIASNSILVGENVSLHYPSSLVINEKDVISEDGQVYIGKFSTIKGVVMFVSKKDLLNSFDTHIKVSEGTRIVGEIYCEGNLELMGEVWGSVYTYQLVSDTAGTIFINHLYNAKISSENFPSTYSGVLLEKQSKNIMKWLY